MKSSVQETAERLVAAHKKLCVERHEKLNMAPRLEDYISLELRETESYNFIDQVKAAAKAMPHS